MRNLINRFRRDESGATAIEYGLIAALMAVVVVAAVAILRPGLEDAFTGVAGELTGAGGEAPAE